MSTSTLPAPGTPSIEVTGLTKRFGRLRALDGLDLRVAAGSVHGFLGPNGAGKSTTIRVLLGMYRRDGGTVRVLGADPAREATAINRRVGHVAGDVALWPALTGAQTLDAVAALRGARDRAREAELIEAFSLDPSKPVRSYSKGNRQKVALVAALAAPVELLILDEPNSGLDPLQQEVLVSAVGRASDDGTTVLLSSHVLEEVERLCSAVTIVKDGRTVETGALADLRRRRTSTLTLRPAPGDDGAALRALGSLPPESVHRDPGGTLRAAVPAEDVPRVLRAVLDAGAAEVSCAPPSLDDLFLRHYAVSAR